MGVDSAEKGGSGIFFFDDDEGLANLRRCSGRIDHENANLTGCLGELTRKIGVRLRRLEKDQRMMTDRLEKKRVEFGQRQALPVNEEGILLRSE